jgi:hypothetical protein
MGGMESQFVIALSVLVLGWYFVGQQAMRRRGLALLHWVRDGMHLLGDKPTLRWLGAAAFQLTIERPVQPFRAVAVTVVLEPREIVFLWLVNRFRQRRDLLVVRGDLTTRPPMRFELFRAQGRSGQEAQTLVRSAGWPVMPFDDSGLRLAASSPLSQDLLHAAIPRLQDHLGALGRLSIHDTSPHLLLNYTLRPGQEGHAAQVFGLVLELARLLPEARADGGRE